MIRWNANTKTYSLPLRLGRETITKSYYFRPYGLIRTSRRTLCLTREAAAFYELRAKGGAAVVTISECVVHLAKPAEATTSTSAWINPNVLPGPFAITASAIKRHGAIASDGIDTQRINIPAQTITTRAKTSSTSGMAQAHARLTRLGYPRDAGRNVTI